MGYRRTDIVSGMGTGPDRFRSALRGVGMGPGGEVVAVGDRAVKVFDGQGLLLRSWSTARPPLSVAVAEDGEVFVGESGAIEVFTRDGALRATWRDTERLGLVTALAVRGDQVWAADARAAAVRRFDRDGACVLSIGEGGARRGFAVPNGFLDFALDPDGNIVAANPGKHRIERFSTDGKRIERFGRFGMEDPADFRGCCNPTNVAVSSDGDVIVTEKAAPRAKVYGADWGLRDVIEGEALFDPECKYLDVAVDGSGRLWIVDTARRRMCVFKELGGEAPRAKALKGVERDG